MNQGIRATLAENVAHIKNKTGGSFDVAARRFRTLENLEMAVIYIDGLVTKEIINDNVIRPLIEPQYRTSVHNIKNLDEALRHALSASDVSEEFYMESALLKLLSGDTLLFCEGEQKCLVIQTRGWKSRGISEPKTQNSVRGPSEAFCETLLFNTALIRRRIKSPDLHFELFTIGRETNTDVCVAYVEGKVDPDVLNLVRARLKKADVEYVLESGHIEQLIEDNPRSLFPSVGNNEKPDIVAAKMLKGRVAILVDGAPFVLTVPMLFVESFHASEDYYSRPYYSSLLRVLRILSYIVTLLLPALYIALVNFHQEMIPQKLLYTIMKAKDGIPFPSIVEILLMLILYEILREAVLRLPTPVGSTVGIVGGLIIGEAAVSAGIVGGPVVVVAAVTFITSAVVNTTIDSTAILRIILLVLAGFLGVFGILLGLFAIFAHLCSLKSFGVPYLMPIAPLKKRDLKDAIVRFPIEDILKSRHKRV